MAIIGNPVDRVDGRLKVTGAAKYAAEFNQSLMSYGYPVGAQIASGIVNRIDLTAAINEAGVIQILTHENALRLKPYNREEANKAGVRLSEKLPLLQERDRKTPP